MLLTRTQCFRGREQTDGTFSHWFRIHECPIGRSLSWAPSRFGVVPTCADSASPGLAAVSGRRPSRIEAIPNATSFRVFPSAVGPSELRHPPRPVDGPQLSLPSSFRVSHQTTHWTFRSGLSCDRQNITVAPILKIDCRARGYPTSEILPFCILANRVLSLPVIR